MAEALGTGAIPAELATILAAHSRNVCKDETARTPEKRSGRLIHSFLTQLASGVGPVPGLEQVTLVGLDPDRRVLLVHSLFSVWFNIYLIHRRLFNCLGDLPAKGLPLVVDIPHKDFAAWCSVSAVPRVNHITHLGGISSLDWQTKPYKRAVKSAGTEYVDLA